MQSIEIDFKKKANLATTLLYSSTWSFTKATIFDGDNQTRSVWIQCKYQQILYIFFLIDFSRTFCNTGTIGTPESAIRYFSCWIDFSNKDRLYLLVYIIHFLTYLLLLANHLKVNLRKTCHPFIELWCHSRVADFQRPLLSIAISQSRLTKKNPRKFLKGHRKSKGIWVHYDLKCTVRGVIDCILSHESNIVLA